MLAVIIGLLLTVAVAVGIMYLVAVPHLRSGAELLTPDGKEAVGRAREKAASTGEVMKHLGERAKESLTPEAPAARHPRKTPKGRPDGGPGKPRREPAKRPGTPRPGHQAGRAPRPRHPRTTGTAALDADPGAAPEVVVPPWDPAADLAADAADPAAAQDVAPAPPAGPAGRPATGVPTRSPQPQARVQPRSSSPSVVGKPRPAPSDSGPIPVDGSDDDQESVPVAAPVAAPVPVAAPADAGTQDDAPAVIDLREPAAEGDGATPVRHAR